MKYFSFYEMAADAAPRLGEVYPAHRAHLEAYHARGLVLAAGPLGDPPSGAIGIFVSLEAAESFCREDPFVREGLVGSWKVLPWRAAFL